MPLVFVPPALRSLTAGDVSVTADGATVRQVLDDLHRRYPGFRDALCDDQGLRSGWAVVVGRAVAADGLDEPVPADAEVHFVAAVGGG